MLFVSNVFENVYSIKHNQKKKTLLQFFAQIRHMEVTFTSSEFIKFKFFVSNLFKHDCSFFRSNTKNKMSLKKQMAQE